MSQKVEFLEDFIIEGIKMKDPGDWILSEDPLGIFWVNTPKLNGERRSDTHRFNIYELEKEGKVKLSDYNI